MASNTEEEDIANAPPQADEDALEDEEFEKEQKRLEEEHRKWIEEQRAAREKAQERKKMKQKNKPQRKQRVELEDTDALLQNLQTTTSAQPTQNKDEEEEETWTAETSKISSQLESARLHASSEVDKLR